MYIMRGRLTPAAEASSESTEEDTLMSSSKNAFNLSAGELRDASRRPRADLRGIAVMTCTVIGDITNGEGDSSSSSSFSRGEIGWAGSLEDEERKCSGLFGSCSAAAAAHVKTARLQYG